MAPKVFKLSSHTSGARPPSYTLLSSSRPLQNRTNEVSHRNGGAWRDCILQDSDNRVWSKGNRQPLKDFSRDSGLHFRRIPEATVREHVGAGEALRREASLETTVPVQTEGVRA